jgi:hypothetical protein
MDAQVQVKNLQFGVSGGYLLLIYDRPFFKTQQATPYTA